MCLWREGPEDNNAAAPMCVFSSLAPHQENERIVMPGAAVGMRIMNRLALPQARDGGRRGSRSSKKKGSRAPPATCRRLAFVLSPPGSRQMRLALSDAKMMMHPTEGTRTSVVHGCVGACACGFREAPAARDCSRLGPAFISLSLCHAPLRLSEAQPGARGCHDSSSIFPSRNGAVDTASDNPNLR